MYTDYSTQDGDFNVEKVGYEVTSYGDSAVFTDGDYTYVCHDVGITKEINVNGETYLIVYRTGMRTPSAKAPSTELSFSPADSDDLFDLVNGFHAGFNEDDAAQNLAEITDVYPEIDSVEKVYLIQRLMSDIEGDLDVDDLVSPDVSSDPDDYEQDSSGKWVQKS